MKLKSVQVKNFKCVEDSTRFDICPVTCLVGKNEAGKTSLLEALHKLNPDVAELGEFDVLQEYPRRRRKQYQRRANADPDDGLITRWELEDRCAIAYEKERLIATK
ncbi:MAG: AAA family ATPase [Planctomycetota bacterium]|jgi:predicted ATP-dependent endonuclease of OLD family